MLPLLCARRPGGLPAQEHRRAVHARRAAHARPVPVVHRAAAHHRWPTPRPSASPGRSSSCSAPVLVFQEPMRWERWLAAAIGFAGVLIVVGPKLSGSGGVYTLVMLASAPVFAASFLMTKALTRYETTGGRSWCGRRSRSRCSACRWRCCTGSGRARGSGLAFLVCGVLGSAGHYCLTRSFTSPTSRPRSR